MSVSFRKLFSEGGLLTASTFTISGFGYIQSLIIAQELGASAYGVIGIVFNLFQFIISFLGVRTMEVTTRYLVEYKTKKDDESLEFVIRTSFILDLVARLLPCLIVFLFSDFFAIYFLDGENNSIYIKLGSLIYILALFDSIWFCICRDIRNFKQLASLPLVLVILKLGLLLGSMLVYRLDLKLVFYIIISVDALGFFIKFFISICYLKKHYSINLFSKSFWTSKLKSADSQNYWSFVKYNYFSNSLSSILKQGDILLLSIFAPNSVVGQYRLARSLCIIIQTIGNSLSQVIYQNFNQLVQTKKFKEIKVSIYRIFKYWTPMVIFILLMSLLCAEFLIVNIFGNQFKDSVKIFYILIFGYGTGMMFFWVVPLAVSFDLVRQKLIFSILTTSIFLILTLLFVPKNGVWAMSYIYSFVWILSSTSYIFYYFFNRGKFEKAM